MPKTDISEVTLKKPKKDAPGWAQEDLTVNVLDGKNKSGYSIFIGADGKLSVYGRDSEILLDTNVKKLVVVEPVSTVGQASRTATAF